MEASILAGHRERSFLCDLAEEVTRQVETNLAELQSDYIDAIMIHGTPGVEQMTVEQCMEVQGEFVKARDKGLVWGVRLVYVHTNWCDPVFVPVPSARKRTEQSRAS